MKAPVSKVRCLDDRVAIENILPDEVRESGIVIPQKAREREPKIHGKIIAVGPGRLLSDGRRGDMILRVGDEVIFQKTWTEVVLDDGRTVTIIPEAEVLCVCD